MDRIRASTTAACASEFFRRKKSRFEKRLFLCSATNRIDQITVDSARVNSKASTEMSVSHTVQVLKVCGTVMLKYSLTSQKPPSLTCDRISEPAPVASTISSGRVPPTDITIGATMPQAVVIATVAEPVATRISAATNQPSSKGDRCASVAMPTIALETPPSIRMRPKPAPAPTTSVMLAIGPRHSLVNLRIALRLKPRNLPKVEKLTKVAINKAITELPIRRRKSLAKVFGAKNTSAQLPINISATGNRIVNSVMPKPGNSRFAPPWSTNWPISGLSGLGITTLDISLPKIGPAMIAVGMPTISAYMMVRPISALYAVTASKAAGWGGIRPCTTDKPATIGIPTSTIEVPVRLATLKAIGISNTKPTSKKTGKPTMNATVIIAQCTFFSPKALIMVVAMRSAPPDSAIILPSMVPRPTTRAICPSVLPTPVSNDLTIVPIGMPTDKPRISDTTIRTMNGFILNLAINTINAITATSA